MSLRTKEILVYGGLLLFTFWPVVHMGLVQTYDLSSWKLGGWGMYATPLENYRGMEVYGKRAEGQAFERLTHPSPDVGVEASRFLGRYQWLRQLARPDALVRRVREMRPSWRDIRVVAFRTDLDHQSSMIVMREHAYDYPR